MLKYKIPQFVTLTPYFSLAIYCSINLHNDVQTTCIHLPQIVLKKRILIANYLTIRILFGAANGIRTRDPQLGKFKIKNITN